MAPLRCSLFRCLILRMYGTVTMKRALCLNSWWVEGSGPMSYLLASKTHCRVPLFFKLKQKKHVSSSLFYKRILNLGFTCCLCVCFVLLRNSGFGGKPVLFYPYLFYLLKLSCSFFAFLCCDAHNFFLKQHSVILISAKRKRVYAWIHISKNTRELSKF